MGVLERDLGDLVTDLGGGADAVVRAIALHADLSAKPDANLTLIRARTADLRGRLLPARSDADARPYGGQSPLRGAVTCRAAQPFSRLSFSAFGDSLRASWFAKEVVREGEWIHPVAGERVTFDRARLDGIARETNRLLGQVGRVPFPDGHRFDAQPTLGWWHAFWLAQLPEGKTALYGLAEVPDPKVAERFGREIRDVSMFLEGETRDSHGGIYRDAITHVAATPYPVIDVQTNFAAIAMSRAGGPTPPAPAPGRLGGEEAMQLSARALEALGFAKDAKPTAEEIEAKAAGLAAKVAEAGRSAEAIALAKERDALAAKVAGFEAAAKAADEKALEDLVLSAKAAVAASGAVEGWAADEQHLRSAWKAGLKDAARAFAARLGAKPAPAPGAKPYEKPADQDATAKRQRDIAAHKATALSQGWETRVEGAGAAQKLFAKKGDREVCLVG